VKRLIALPAVLGLFAVAAPAARAASPVIQETVPVQSVFGGSVVDPCNGEPITWTGNVHVLGAMITDGDGGAVFLAHVDFQDVHGTDPTRTRYTIALASNESIVFAPSSPTLPIENVFTHVIRLDIVSAGSTSNFSEYEVGHYTIRPAGQIAVVFDNVDTRSCSS
jgi:hypothetical protein